MIKKIIFIFIALIIFPNHSFSTNIGVIDIEKIINSNKEYIQILKQIEDDQEKNSIIFKEKEFNLQEEIKEIEESKLLLDQDELNKMINNYNNNLSKFSVSIDKFNEYYEQQLINIRKHILQEIIVLSEKYAKDNNIELILDSTSYFIASNNVNITSVIIKELDDITLNLELKNFEKD